MPIERIHEILERRMGLRRDALGSEIIRQGVERRMLGTGLPEPADYLHRLETVPGELVALADDVAVSETWFFRLPGSFRFLEHHVRERRSRDALRVLSIPCSTGEEPYSIAMCLELAGVPSADYRIDAIDVRPSALDLASRAVYPARAFRGSDLSFRDRFFAATPDGYRLARHVVARVRFVQGSILDPSLLRGEPPYDVVFCRNLLIYFSGWARAVAVALLDRVLTDGGVLFAGHAETSSVWGEGFAPVGRADEFAYRKHGRAGARASRARMSTADRPAAPKVRRRSTDHRSSPPAREPAAAPVPTRAELPAAHSSLAEAARLADAGLLEPAARCCQRAIDESGPSASAFFLLGVVQQAGGAAQEAEKSLTGALYLEPSHREALVCLALVKESLGDNAGAQLLRERLGRLGPGRP